MKKHAQFAVILLILLSIVVLAGCIGGKGTKDCGSNMTCFQEAAVNCSKAELTQITGEGTELETSVFSQIKGKGDDNCTFYMEIIEFPLLIGIEGKSMTCGLPMEDMENVGGETIPLPSDTAFSDLCSGSLVDSMEQIIDALEREREENESTECESPKVLIGTECCLDENENNVCDSAELPSEKTDIEKVQDYLNEHPLEQFSDMPERIFLVDISDGKAYLNYRTGKNDPAQESTYLAGVLFLTFEDITSTDIKGYNLEGGVINNSHKFPTRKQYNFDNYRIWFPDVEIEAECSTDADCDDDNNCTKDKCYNGQCSNVEIVDCIS